MKTIILLCALLFAGCAERDMYCVKNAMRESPYDGPPLTYEQATKACGVKP